MCLIFCHVDRGKAKFKVYTNLNDNCGTLEINAENSTFVNVNLTSDVISIGLELVEDTADSFDVISLDIKINK
ncbi:MAG: hypothetical protein R3Y26_11510 [Rikenellaceae bacterium]